MNAHTTISGLASVVAPQDMIRAALDAGQTVPGTARDDVGTYTFDMAETKLWVARQTIEAGLPNVARLSDDELTDLFYRALMTFQISDELAQQAFDVLQGNRHALAKMVYDRTDRERKVLLARLEREANEKSLRNRETYALTHPHYSALIERLEAAEREYYLARDERDSAETIMRTWQTLRADARAGAVR